jgi:PHD/YefM family antitoxin component YafN of YafNO toxin-antitoxin module
MRSQIGAPHPALESKDFDDFIASLVDVLNKLECGKVYFIIDKSREVDQPVLVVSNGVSYVFTNAMEIEEYESIMIKENDNSELIKQIEKTEKELAELKNKLK